MNDTAPDVRDYEDAPLVRYRHPFALVPLWVIERVDSYAAIKVYVALASFASGPMDGERTAYPSVRAIAERAGM